MPSSTDIGLYKQAHQKAVTARMKASQLISRAPSSLQQILQGWESEPVCPSGNYSVSQDILVIAANKKRIFVPSTTDEKQIAGALVDYYDAALSSQKKWALLLPYQQQGLTPPDPLTFA